MILSHRHRFLFIKGRKVAGTSIEMLLSRICGPEDVVTPMLPIDERQRIALGGMARNYAAEPALEAAYRQLVLDSDDAQLAQLRLPGGRFYNHMGLGEVRALAGPLAGYHILAAERSPYAKLLSWLNMAQRLDAYRGGGEMTGDPARFARHFDRIHQAGALAAVRNIDLYRDGGGLDVEVLRYETLQHDLDSFAAGIGVALGTLPHAKRGLMSDTLDPLALLRRDQIDLVNTLYAEEFEAFGYPML